MWKLGVLLEAKYVSSVVGAGDILFLFADQTLHLPLLLLDSLSVQEGVDRQLLLSIREDQALMMLLLLTHACKIHILQQNLALLLIAYSLILH